MGMTILSALGVTALVVAAYFAGKERLRRALAGGAAGIIAVIFIWSWLREGRAPAASSYGMGLFFAFASACIAAAADRLLATFASATGATVLVLWAVLAVPREGTAGCAGLSVVLHAAAFMAGYASLAAAAAAGGTSLRWKNKESDLAECARLAARVALAFLAGGAVLGAFLARAKWGEYWAWDVKEAASLVPLALVAASGAARAQTRAGRKLVLLAAAAAAAGYFALGFLPASNLSLHPG